MARENTNKSFWERVARIYTRFMSGMTQYTIQSVNIWKVHRSGEKCTGAGVRHRTDYLSYDGEGQVVSGNGLLGKYGKGSQRAKYRE